jgi:hypothetical protein
VAFAGALQYREYDFATRLVMRLLMQRGEHPTAISRDFDYTDWDAVDAFARACAEHSRSRHTRDDGVVTALEIHLPHFDASTVQRAVVSATPQAA